MTSVLKHSGGWGDESNVTVHYVRPLYCNGDFMGTDAKFSDKSICAQCPGFEICSFEDKFPGGQFRKRSKYEKRVFFTF